MKSQEEIEDTTGSGLVAPSCSACDGTGLEKADLSNGRQSTGKPCPICSVLDSMREALKNTGNPQWSRDWIKDIWKAMPRKLQERTSLHDLREMGKKLEAKRRNSACTVSKGV